MPKITNSAKRKESFVSKKIKTTKTVKPTKPVKTVKVVAKPTKPHKPKATKAAVSFDVVCNCAGYNPGFKVELIGDIAETDKFSDLLEHLRDQKCFTNEDDSVRQTYAVQAIKRVSAWVGEPIMFKGAASTKPTTGKVSKGRGTVVSVEDDVDNMFD